MIKDGAFVVLFKDKLKKEVFMVYRSDFPIWGVTGGGIEKNETPEIAAIREAKEESGYKVEIVRNVGVYEKNLKGTKCKYYLFEGKVISGEFKPEFDGCKGRWFFVDKLPLSMTYENREMIIDCLRQENKIFRKEQPQMFLKENIHLFFLHPLASLRFFFNERERFLSFLGFVQ